MRQLWKLLLFAIVAIVLVELVSLFLETRASLLGGVTL